MEDGSNEISFEINQDHIKNGVVSPIMANCPEGTTETNEIIPKLNGDANLDEDSNNLDNSSESDALVIDENVPSKQKSKRKRIPKNQQARKSFESSPLHQQKELERPEDIITESPIPPPQHFNPFFNESLFELTQQHHSVGPSLQSESEHQAADIRATVTAATNESCPLSVPTTATSVTTQHLPNFTKFHKHKRLKKNSPKLREYAQYLGLQPTVQFRCSRCNRAGFASLTTLNEHIVQCTDEPTTQPQVQDSSLSSFKLTRKVFLCSACGTYYENWNLYLHMIEVHRRYLCLYCLGMFSVLDDLCLHIQTKHNFEPGHKDSLQDFYNTYRDPCYIVCVDCGKLFNEQDNFFYHVCAKKDLTNININNAKGGANKNSVNNSSHNINSNSNKVINKLSSKIAKQQIRPEDHVTGDSANDNIEQQINGDSNGRDDRRLDNLVAREIDGSDKKPFEEHSTNRFIDNTKQSQSYEIVYSSDSDLDFKGFDDDGEPVYINKTVDLSDRNSASPPPVNDSINEEEEEKMDDTIMQVDERPVETRKVPKLSLKLKLGSFPEIEREQQHDNNSDDGENMPNDIEQIESENETRIEDSSVIKSVDGDDDFVENDEDDSKKDEVQIAGPEIPIVELQLEQPLDKFDIKLLLQKCLNATASACIYCNHARKIAVNGKRLGLHAMAQHRYSAVVSSITAEELIPESFVTRIKENLPMLEDVYFNLESNPSDEAVTFSHIFECFQCRYATTIHKELYLHNRKSHAKNLLLCIMCKLNFYSYSELICHLCPGAYIIDYDVQFRCCMCISDDLPSAFRLMVHLRKRHHVCDVCLEMCHSQYKLSSHVWKHKLHHFCYRCGIAYRNKPDITRHLFWKHGTESVLCKKCLQKKWPHVYHFCVPPTSFLCEECNLTFSRAVSLKVHKRIHSDDRPHTCTFEECKERFISKKLLAKHEYKHREPPEEIKTEVVEEPKPEIETDVKTEEQIEEKVEDKEKIKPKIDVYDLPELNLSESDSSDSETEEQKKDNKNTTEEDNGEKVEEILCEDVLDDNKASFENLVEESTKLDEPTTTEVLENIWDDFKNYQANKEKFDNLLTEVEKSESQPLPPIEDEPLTLEKALLDHDYCIDPDNKPDVSFTEVKPDLSQSVDHDYCTAKNPIGEEIESENNKVNEVKKEEIKASPKKRSNSSSSSSSGSDSSSCSCGPNCSCSSSSGSSSSTSDSSDSDSSTEEGRKRQQIRRDKRRQRATNIKKQEQKKPDTKVVDVVTTTEQPVLLSEISIHESDLDTTESETDEEFYDKQPHLLAKKILEEKRNQLLAGIEATPNGSMEPLETSRPPTPNLPEEPRSKKKSKSKKKKKRKNERKEAIEAKEYDTNIPNPYYQYYQPPTVAPITLSLSRNSPAPSPSAKLPPQNLYPKNNTAEIVTTPRGAGDESDINLRASKRRRVPNKFYGYSSDEEDTAHTPKWRKTEPPPPPHPIHNTPQQQQQQQQQQNTSSSMFVVPPITIKTTPSIPPFSIRSTSHPGQMKVHPKKMPPIKLKTPKQQAHFEEIESEAESNDSSNEGRNMLQVNPDALYCYCKCPYDEVSEMIGCDARDCSIEWFHFECVGIMVPPKGHWYCPECRKKRQQKREMLKMKAKQSTT